MIGRRLVLTAGIGGFIGGCASVTRKQAAQVPVERLATLDGATAGLALMLGRHQQATASFLAKDPIVEAIAMLQEGPVVDVSSPGGQLELEKLVALSPTRVIGLSGGPVEQAVVLDRISSSVQRVARTGRLAADSLAVGAALGRLRRTRHALTMLSASRQQLQSALRSRSAPTISIISPGLAADSIFTVGGATPAASTVAALDLRRPAAQAKAASSARSFVPVSLEHLPEHDADLVFVAVGPTVDPRWLYDRPLWRQLGAVRRRRVIEVDALQWATTSSLLGNWWVLDDLAAVLREDACPIVGSATFRGIQRLARYRALFGE